MRWLLTNHSVLGFEVQPPDPADAFQRKALLFASPFGLCIRVLIFSAYVAGFLLTARLVRELVQSKQIDWVSALSFLRSRLVRLFLFALALFAVFILILLPASAVLNVSVFAPLRGDLSQTTLITAAAFLTYVVIAWIMIPWSFWLIGDGPSRRVPPRMKKYGRIAAIEVAAIAIVLNYYVSIVTASINLAFEADIWLRKLVIWPSISILEGLPFVLLWVFLAVLAYQDLELPEIPSPS